MKVMIKHDTGFLHMKPETELEHYALRRWCEEQSEEPKIVIERYFADDEDVSYGRSDSKQKADGH